MDRRMAAVTRFTAALDTLEAKLTERLEDRASATLEAELAALRLERERLRARIALLEEETSSLAGLTETVESRLDGAIAEIRAALERN